MIGALVYLQVQSVRNRLRVRIGRLKKPKYLVGALVGAAYFYFFFLRNLFASSRAPAAVNPSSSPETLALTELLGALVLLARGALASPASRVPGPTSPRRISSPANSA